VIITRLTDGRLSADLRHTSYLWPVSAVDSRGAMLPIAEIIV
jgi:hypothetical protein